MSWRNDTDARVVGKVEWLGTGVVDDDALEVVVVLRQHRLECFAEPSRPVVRGHDDGEGRADHTGTRVYDLETAAGLYRSPRGRERMVAMTHDLVIRDGTLVDGAGLPPYRADVAVDDGRIAKVGTGARTGHARRSTPKATSSRPGFIDGHTHMDAQLFWDPLGTPVLLARRHHRGDGQLRLHPRPGARRRACSSSSATSSAPKTSIAGALAAGIDWKWETFAEYLDAVDRRPKGINYAAQIGHSALRT